jgi:hypothetical protein
MLLLCLGASNRSMAQFEDPLNLNNVPPSPEAAEMGKYGEHPVSLFAGTPTINVPIWTANSRQLGVSVSLSYHASGVKVEQQSPWTGLSWNLNAGGAITRTVRGLPDESTNGYFKNSNASNIPPNGLDPDVLADFNTLRNIADNSIDAEPDIYFYNFPGFSGSFIFDQYGEAHTLNYKNVDIRRTSTDNREFLILSPGGTTYRFGLSLNGTEAFEETDISKTAAPKFKSTWYLTEIIAPNEVDVISFKYTPTAGGATINYNMYETIRYGEGPGGQGQGETCDMGEQGVDYSAVNQTIIYPKLYLSEIHFATGKIEFTSTTDRQDHTVMKKLDAITVKDLAGNTIRKFELNYGYFNASSSEMVDKRLRLDEIYEKDFAGVSKTGTKPLYSFEYYDREKDFYRSLPGKDSKDQDHHGYFNNRHNSTLVPKVVYADKPLKGGNREVSKNDQDLLVGTLKKIVYPTGGYTKFDMEVHDYKSLTENFKRIGGLRIKQLITFDGISDNNNLIKTYKYTNEAGTESSGKLIGQDIDPESYGYQMSNATATGSGYYFCNFYARSATSKSAMGSSGAPVGYTRVTEYIGTPSSNSGKTVSEFKFVADNPGGGFPFRPSQSMNWHRGQLLKKSTYANINGQYKLRSQIENDYTFHGAEGQDNVFIINAVIVGTKTSGIIHGTGYNDDAFEYDYYQTKTGWAFMHQSISRTYQDDNEARFTEVTTNYKYDNSVHAMPTEVEVINSDGSSSITRYKYPQDFSFSCTKPVNCDREYYETCYEELFDCRADRLSACNVLHGQYTTAYLDWIDYKETLTCCFDLWGKINRYYNDNVKQPKQDWLDCVEEYENAQELSCEDAMKVCTSGIGSACNLDDYYICIDNAYYIADDRIKIIHDLIERARFNTPIEVSLWHKENGGTEKLLKSRFYEYKWFNDIPGRVEPMLLVEKVWELNTEDGITDFTETKLVEGATNTMAFDSRYEKEVFFQKYNYYGSPTELHKDDNVLNAYSYSYEGSFTVSSAKGAESSNDPFTGGSYSYLGFESGKESFDPVDPDNDYWIFNGLNNHLEATAPTDAYTGKFSRKILSGEFGPTKIFKPVDQEQKFIMSAWVKTESGFVADKGRLYMHTLSENPAITTIYPASTSGTEVDIKFGDSQGDWIYVETVIDLEQIRTDASIPTSEKLQIVCYVENQDVAKYFLVDDIRFRPYTSQMSTYSYNPFYGQTSVSGDNNTATNHEFDSFGRLHLSKDHNKDIAGRINYDFDVYSTDPLDFDIAPTLTGDYTFLFNVTGNTNSNYRYYWTFDKDTPEISSGSSSSTSHTYGGITAEHHVSVRVEDISIGEDIGWPKITVTARKVGGSTVPCNEVDDILTVFDKASHVATITTTDIPNAIYTWTFGDGNWSTTVPDNEVTHTYNTQGSYEVTAGITVEETTCFTTGKVDVIFQTP